VSGGAEPTHQLWGNLRNVTGPEREHDIPGPQFLIDGSAYISPTRLKPGIGTGALRSICHLLSAHACHGLLACGVDLCDEHEVGQRQSFSHSLSMSRGAGEQVRLEDSDQSAARVRLPRCRERGCQLRGVVRVVVHHGDPGKLSQALESAANTLEVRECRSRELNFAAQRVHGSQRGDRVS
jgi:hypothetical protein